MEHYVLGEAPRRIPQQNHKNQDSCMNQVAVHVPGTNIQGKYHDTTKERSTIRTYASAHHKLSKEFTLNSTQTLTTNQQLFKQHYKFNITINSKTYFIYFNQKYSDALY